MKVVQFLFSILCLTLLPWRSRGDAIESQNTVYNFNNENYFIYHEYFKHLFDWHHGTKLYLNCSLNIKSNKINCMVIPTKEYHGKSEIAIYLLRRKDCDEFFRSNDYIELDKVELLGATRLRIGKSDIEWEYTDDVYELYDRNSKVLGNNHNKKIFYFTFKNSLDEYCKVSYEYTKEDFEFI